MNKPEFVYLNKDILFNQVLCPNFDQEVTTVLKEAFKDELDQDPDVSTFVKLKNSSFISLSKNDWSFILCLVGEIQRRIRMKEKNKEFVKDCDFILTFSSMRSFLRSCGIVNSNTYHQKTAKLFLSKCIKLADMEVSKDNFEVHNIISNFTRNNKLNQFKITFCKNWIYKTMENFITIYMSDIFKITSLRELRLWFLLDSFTYKITELNQPLIRTLKYVTEILEIDCKEDFKKRQTIELTINKLYKKEILTKLVSLKFIKNMVVFYQKDLYKEIDSMIPDEIDFSDYE